ncbi:hypothetical protein [Streptomyces panacea]|uniref:hypothetical protein n=1 Tax=Streptomyces panacea TaxID=3035064 RepID=UPI003F4A47C5
MGEASRPRRGSGRRRLRAVDRDEAVPLAAADEAGRLVDFLAPGSTWLPAPAHALPTLPGRPPMVGYLVLVPADFEVARRPGDKSTQARWKIHLVEEGMRRPPRSQPAPRQRGVVGDVSRPPR